MDSSHTPVADPAAVIAALGSFSLVFLAIIVFSLVLNWKIASKAGYSGAMSLLVLVPLVNLIVIVYFAFSEWPIERALKQARGGGGGFGGYMPTVPSNTPPPIMPYLPPPETPS